MFAAAACVTVRVTAGAFPAVMVMLALRDELPVLSDVTFTFKVLLFWDSDIQDALSVAVQLDALVDMVTDFSPVSFA